MIVPPIAILAIIYGRYLRSISKRTQDALAQATQVRRLAAEGGFRLFFLNFILICFYAQCYVFLLSYFNVTLFKPVFAQPSVCIGVI